MDYYVYMTTNLINGKKYIGQHKGQPDDSYLGSGILLKKAIKKYGRENFSKEILCFCETKEEVDKKEQEYIDFYQADKNENFYNIARGGKGQGGWLGVRQWAEANPEKAKELHRQGGERLQQWAKDNPELFKEKVIRPFTEAAKEYWKEHPEKKKEHMAKMNEAKGEWQKTHREEHEKQVEEWRKKGSETNSQKIICVTTGEIFPSQCEAARYYGIAQANISKCLSGERKSAGKHPQTKEKLLWQLYTE